MNHHPDPPLKSPSATSAWDRLAAAPLEPGSSERLSGRPKAVPSHPTLLAQLPRQGGDVSDTAERPFVGLHVIAPPDWRGIPSATAVCRCGRSRHARGRERVRGLIEAYTAHRATCTGQPENSETTRSAA